MFVTPASRVPQGRSYRWDMAFSCALLSISRVEMMFRGRCVVHVRFRQNDLYFRHRDHRQKTNEKQEERSENPERADERPDIHPSRIKHSPGRGQEIAMQSADDNDETLEPHAGVHAHANEINDEDISPAPTEPE